MADRDETPYCEKHKCYCVWTDEDAEGEKTYVCPKCAEEAEKAHYHHYQ